MKKRIAIWTHGGIGGGFESQGQPNIQRLVSRLSEDFDIDIFSLLPPDKDFSPERFRIYSCPRKIEWRPLRWVWLIVKFLTLYKAKNYGLMYAFWGYPAGIPAVVMGRVCKVKSILHLQGGDAAHVPSIGYGVFVHPYRAKICQYIYERSSVIIALTEYQAQSLRRNGVAKKCIVIPFGVDETKFCFRTERLTEKMVRFLHVGNQTAVKDQLTILRAFAEISKYIPATLTFIGEDVFNGQVKRWCDGLGIADRVIFHGPILNKHLPQYYHDADVLLHASLYEGQGLVFSEAAACGTLIAGTKTGMLWDMETDCALTVPVGDWRFLSEKILGILKSREEYDLMRIRAAKSLGRYQGDYTYRAIAELIQSNISSA